MADPVAQLYLRRQRDMLKELKKYKAPSPRRFHASALGNCKTQLYYRLAGYIPALEPVKSTGYSYDGDMHHDQVRRMLREAGFKIGGVSFQSDGTVKEDQSYVLPVNYRGVKFDVSMRLDGFINISGKKHVLEIKSIGFWKYKPLATLWDKTRSTAALLAYIQENRRDFMYQTHACMLAAKTGSAYLVFKDRDSCTIGLHAGGDVVGGPVIKFNPDIWEEACQRISTVVTHLELGSPPVPEFIASSFECQLCRYRHLCHDADKRRATGQMPATIHPQLGTRLHVKDK